MLTTKQEVFDYLVDEGIYGYSIFSTPFMCSALNSAHLDDLLSKEQREEVKDAIRGFLKDLVYHPVTKTTTLSYAIAYYISGQNSDTYYKFTKYVTDDVLLAVYRNWDGRWDTVRKLLKQVNEKNEPAS